MTGGTLEMILSKATGGSLNMPDLVCKSYDEAVFQLQTLDLVIGEQISDATVDDPGSAFIYNQQPAADSRVYTGDTIKIYLTQIRPDDCDEN